MAKQHINGQFRIIGGQWRGRRFNFAEEAAVRPTPDRVRETVFNWLANDIAHSRCLDLFTGSGALGLEALSRGADHAVFIDKSAAVVKQLNTVIQQLNCQQTATVIQTTLPATIKIPHAPFDIIFLDPPYHQNLIAPCCQWLEQQQLLAEQALIYIEAESSLAELNLPENWKILRQKKAGQVGYYLVRNFSE